MKTSCMFTFFGEQYTCTRMKGIDGAEFSPKRKVCNVLASYTPDEFRAYAHHELLEAAITLAGRCYTCDYPDTRELFVMGHTAMDIISGQVRVAYDEIVQKMGAEA